MKRVFIFGQNYISVQRFVPGSVILVNLCWNELCNSSQNFNGSENPVYLVVTLSVELGPIRLHWLHLVISKFEAQRISTWKKGSDIMQYLEYLG